MPNVLPFDIFAIYFSNFSGHMLEFHGTLYPTAEHAYHCQRFTDPKLIDKILHARSARKAWEIAQQHKKKQVADWDTKKLIVMEELFRAKLDQHPDVRKALIDSGDQTIVKHQPDDAFWGDGPDGNGRNEMGKLWMKIRDQIK